MNSFKCLAALLTFCNAGVIWSCDTIPDGVSSFIASDFAGYWYLNKSSLNKADRVGCASWQITNPNSNGKLETAFSKNKIFTWNPLEKGK
jgi:hypothetical protein